MKSGIELIAEERAAHPTRELWTARHDDSHTNHEMAITAAIYAAPGAAQGFGVGQRVRNKILGFWPWDRRWYKPTPEDRVRELVKAGALCAAEIDRLLRKQNPTPVYRNTRRPDCMD